jgi:hypothetical protein
MAVRQSWEVEDAHRNRSRKRSARSARRFTSVMKPSDPHSNVQVDAPNFGRTVAALPPMIAIATGGAPAELSEGGR